MADAFGIEKLILCGGNITLGRKTAKTARATEKIVNYDIRESATEVVESLKKQGYQIISLEITDSSEPIHSFKFSNKK